MCDFFDGWVTGLSGLFPAHRIHFTAHHLNLAKDFGFVIICIVKFNLQIIAQ